MIGSILIKLKPLEEFRVVFSSLLRKWNAFSEKKLPSGMETEFEKIRAERLRLKTEIVPLSKENITGFVGKVVYEISEVF